MLELFRCLASGRQPSLLDYNADTIDAVRETLPSPMGGSHAWSAIGYAAWRVLSRRTGEGVLRGSFVGCLLPDGAPSDWVNHDGVPAGWSLRGLLLLAACQNPNLFDSNGPGQGSTVNRLWTSDLTASIQADRRALIDEALTTACHLWSAPRFTVRQRESLARAVTQQLLRWCDNDDVWVAQRLAASWPTGATWDRLWDNLAQGYPVLQAQGRACKAQALVPHHARPRRRS